MGQPVVDTLQLSDALRLTGMDREQADGIARALGRELGEHVAARGEVEAGFQAVRAEVALLRANLEGRLDTLNAKLTLSLAGLGLMLSVVVGLGVLDRIDPPAVHAAPTDAGQHAPPPYPGAEHAVSSRIP